MRVIITLHEILYKCIPYELSKSNFKLISQKIVLYLFRFNAIKNYNNSNIGLSLLNGTSIDIPVIIIIIINYITT